MMGKLFMTVGQITVGVIVGNAASGALNKLGKVVKKSVKDMVEAKKMESK